MKKKKGQGQVYNAIILHNVRSIQNVGSIFRTADTAGIDEITLTGYTPLPVDRFGRERTIFNKTALGAQKTILWRHKDDVFSALSDYESRGIDTVAVEQSETSIDYRTLLPSTPRVFVFGNEVEGIPDEVIKRCSSVIEIPLYGKKESLNVAVAVGVVLFRIAV